MFAFFVFSLNSSTAHNELDSRITSKADESKINTYDKNNYCTLPNSFTKEHKSSSVNFIGTTTNNADNILDAIYNNGEIGDRVWEDANGDGLQDDGEVGIPGVSVYLEDTDGNNIPGVIYQVTGPEGKFLFQNLPMGNYIVHFETPSGYAPTTPNKDGDETIDSDASQKSGKTKTITLTPQNSTYIDADAGYFKKTNIIGIFWIDEDQDGQQGLDELGVEGVRVRLYKAGDDMISGTNDDEFVEEVSTDNLGYYHYNNVEPAKYYYEYEERDIPIGYKFTFINFGGSDNTDSDVFENTGLSEVFQVFSNTLKSGVDAGVIMICDFIPSVHIGDPICEDSSVHLEAYPFLDGYTYEWEFLDDEINPEVIGTSSDGITNFTWQTSGVKTFNLKVTNQFGCSIEFSESFMVFSSEDEVCSHLLPIEIMDFTAELFENNKVFLKWVTFSEENNSLFEIQRSTNGDLFETLDSVFGNGSTNLINNYDFIDQSPLYGRNHYRIRHINFDGTTTLSEAKTITLGNEEFEGIIIYPNPTKEISILKIDTPFESETTIEVMNAAGQVLEVVIMEAGSNSQIIDLNNYQPGFYFLNIKYDDFKKLVHRVLKINK